MLTVKQAAALMGVSHCTVRNLIARGRLPHYRPAPRAIRISPDDLDAYMQSVRVEGTADDDADLASLVHLRMPRSGGMGADPHPGYALGRPVW
jgi:excisionase family DNA binding protein